MNISVPQARLGMIACAVLTAIGFGLYKLLDMDLIMFLTFIPAAGILFFGHHNRCPHCGHGLLRLRLDTLHCPYCGGPL